MAADHLCRVLAAPWPGVYATEIDSARHYGKHWHSTYGLGLMDQGAHRSSSGRGAVEAYAGDIVTTNPGEVHDGRPIGGPSRRWRTVYVDPILVREIAGKEVAFTRAAFRDEQLRCSLAGLLAGLEWWGARAAHAFDPTLRMQELLVEACGLMVRRHSTARMAEEPAEAMPEVIERLVSAATPTLDELAQVAGVGKFQLLRRFRRAYGTTPHAWLVQHRAERARTLIARGMGLADAASEAGFADQSHLTRVFTQRFGFTPGAWRKAQSRSRRGA